jgi:hypothetical protein
MVRGGSTTRARPVAAQAPHALGAKRTSMNGSRAGLALVGAPSHVRHVLLVRPAGHVTRLCSQST